MSDIEGRFTDYSHLMLDSLKSKKS
jgi:hypothetical protein